MDSVVVRHGEIGSKSRKVRKQMEQILRQRVEDRLQYEEIDYTKVSLKPSIIVVRTDSPEEVAEFLSEVPGVSRASPSISCEAEIESMKQAAEQVSVGDTFGVSTNRSGSHSFDSEDVNAELGETIRIKNQAEVDLDDPDTWVEVDINDSEAFIYTESFDGPEGFPVGSQGSMAALISGGIDSPVAAYRMMCRGVNIEPIYFYNKPYASEDHVLRLEAAVKELKRMHPSRDWSYTIVDMEEINSVLSEEIGSGRMVVQRRMMFRIASRIALEKGLKGIITGESLGQKSSQTGANLAVTSQISDLPVHRPLLDASKSDITAEARELGTYRHSKVDSACRTISPNSPDTSADIEWIRQVEDRIDAEKLVEEAVNSAEKRPI